MLLMGFGNKARHGKDTAAEAIKDHYENHFFSWNHEESRPTTGVIKVGIFKYASALYGEVNDFLAIAQELGLPWNKLRLPLYHEPDVKIGPITDTSIKYMTIPDWVTPDPNPEINKIAPLGKHPKLLQWWGTEYRRNNFGEDYWVKRTFASIPTNLDIALISDVRFPNEAQAIERRGGYSVLVQRLRKDGTLYADSSRPVDHPSETALDGYNWNFYIKSPDGHAALTAEFAITLAEYLRGLQ